MNRRGIGLILLVLAVYLIQKRHRKRLEKRVGSINDEE